MMSSSNAATVCGLVVILATLGTAVPARYDGYKILRITPETHSDHMELKFLFLAFRVDVWRSPRNGTDPYVVMVNPRQADWLTRALHVLNLRINVVIPDVQSHVQGNSSAIQVSSSEFNWTDYHPLDKAGKGTVVKKYGLVGKAVVALLFTSHEYIVGTGQPDAALVIPSDIAKHELETVPFGLSAASPIGQSCGASIHKAQKLSATLRCIGAEDTLAEIHQWLRTQAKQHNNTASILVPGKSTENRPLLGIRIAHGPKLPIVVIEGGIHAREWISPATAMWLAKEALSGISPIARAYEWHIFPVVNPDGYVYTFTQNRFWRKSRSSRSANCAGVDLNRNFSFRWKSERNTSYCSETYPGPSATSEPETKAMSTYLQSVAPRTKVYLTLHSYGQYLMYPWGFSTEPVRNVRRLTDIAAKAVRKLAARHGTQYQYGQISTTLYHAFGNSLDYAYSLNISYAYTFELRGDSALGSFVLPPSQIIPTAEETFDAVAVILEEARK